MDENDLPRLVVRMKEDEARKLTNAWKRAEGVTNRSQYIKAAVNAYANEKIFELKEVKE